MKILVLAAGPSDEFHEAGHAYPKNLVEIGDRPLIEHVLEPLAPLAVAGENIVCMVPRAEDDRFHTAEVIKLLHPKAVVLPVPPTAGAECTALHAVDLLDDAEDVLVYNGDHIVNADLAAITDEFRRRDLDAGVVVFDAVHPRWSYVRCDEDGFVVEAAEKRPISRLATAGTFWFRRADALIAALEEMIVREAEVDGLYYVCPALNEMILRGQRIGIYIIPRSSYHSLASPRGL